MVTQLDDLWIVVWTPEKESLYIISAVVTLFSNLNQPWTFPFLFASFQFFSFSLSYFPHKLLTGGRLFKESLKDSSETNFWTIALPNFGHCSFAGENSRARCRFPKPALCREKLLPFPPDLGTRWIRRPQNIKHIWQTTITKEFGGKFCRIFWLVDWASSNVGTIWRPAAAMPNIRIFSKIFSNNILQQYTKDPIFGIDPPHTAGSKSNIDFSTLVFSDDKIVDNAFVFTVPFYFNCPIGHVILKTWHVCPHGYILLEENLLQLKMVQRQCNEGGKAYNQP